MNEHEEQAKTEEKVYPGSLAEYLRLRTAREAGNLESESNLLLLEIAEQLAGLAYIADGIRYTQRNK